MEHAVVEVVVYLTSYPSSIVTQAQAVHVQTLDCTLCCAGLCHALNQHIVSVHHCTAQLHAACQVNLGGVNY